MAQNRTQPPLQQRTLLDAAERFYTLYARSEHEGDSWGDGHSADHRAAELAAAIDQAKRHPQTADLLVRHEKAVRFLAASIHAITHPLRNHLEMLEPVYDDLPVKLQQQYRDLACQWLDPLLILMQPVPPKSVPLPTGKKPKGHVLDYAIPQGVLAVDGLASDRCADLTRKESERGGRVIGGDHGDLHFNGYGLDRPNNRTILHDPVLKTTWKLEQETAIAVAQQILKEAVASIGLEALEHS